ncbi:hypothetical protein B0H10DRAFT_1810418 [Mycena sp. CBHHK59/15]|nr:hypothetical protein B0H10DRAFT_1810418 [Mycena sp. CBHHK59/15]
MRNICLISSQVIASLEPGSVLENIADLTHKLIQGTTIQATLQLYIQVAFIRFIAVKYPWLSEDTFWLQVDEIIKDNSKQCETKEELDGLYNFIYQEDIKVHGDPADTEHRTAELNESSTSWQAVVRKHSKKVLPNAKNQQILLKAHQAWMAEEEMQTRKRRRGDPEE